MNTGICKSSDAQSWKDLYQIVIRESDMNKLLDRIADAEAALALRARELFYMAGDSSEEQESLDDALCILQALRSSLKRRASAIPSTSTLNPLKRA